MNRNEICTQLEKSFEHCYFVNEDGLTEEYSIELTSLDNKGTKGTNYVVDLTSLENSQVDEYFLSLTIWQKSATIKVVEVIDASPGAVDVQDICILDSEIKKLKISLDSWTEDACNLKNWITWAEETIIDRFKNDY